MLGVSKGGGWVGGREGGKGEIVLYRSVLLWLRVKEGGGACLTL